MITTPNAECILSAQYMSFSVSNRACYCSDDNTDTYQYLLTQTYPWLYPTGNCTPIIRTATGVTNLTCVTGCSTDGGYVTHPISTATDCISYNTSLGMLTSEQSVNTTLDETAYFWLAFQGKAWRGLDNSAASSSQWSIVSLIDLRQRSDGLINTPPVGQVTSAQYVLVNQTALIKIQVSDVNVNDNIRCLWASKNSTYRVNECGDACGMGNASTQTNLSDCTLTITPKQLGA
ncbi:unnamed protein product [Rotaria socialis]|uniref:Uncharacterized protein n=1 Tax=Rotaria socialis TaxID=392032 RepID=A0A821HUI3_9BILA|nr:unnamed protein product [Rotaria socialis]CAF4688591.1 unnamed protein product [Rotaria socialis]